MQSICKRRAEEEAAAVAAAREREARRCAESDMEWASIRARHSSSMAKALRQEVSERSYSTAGANDCPGCVLLAAWMSESVYHRWRQYS